MSEPLRFISPVNLRKTQVPFITIYGREHDDRLARLIWEFIPGMDVRVVTPHTIEDLHEAAIQSAIVFIIVKDASDANIKLAEDLSHLKGLVADVIAITPEQDIRHRLHMHSAKYDAIYNLDILSTDDFKNIFLHKLKKGIVRLNSRLQEDEYETFLGFLSASADSFIVFDKQKRIFYVSDQYLKLYPKNAGSFVRGTPVQKVFDIVMHEMGVAPGTQAYADSLGFWTRLKGEHEFRMDNGVHLRLTAVDLPGGQGTIVSTTNVTAYKEQERALAEKQKELERALVAEQEASSLQKQFISMVSHEFRTPLAIVDGNAQILERRVDNLNPEEARTRLRTIRSAVSRTLNMMQAVLSSNLLKTGKLDVTAEHFSLRDIIRDMCREQSDLARDHIINVDVDRLPESVWMDQKIITLVLTNLLANAVKFTPENPLITVTGWEENDMAYVSIADNGIGIPANEIDKIFDRFYRASSAQAIPGSGVGLSLVRDLVSVHDGKISVVSESGKGSVFTFCLPYRCPCGGKACHGS